MKKIFIVLVCQLSLTTAIVAQSEDSTMMMKFRNDFIAAMTDNQTALNAIYALTDSMLYSQSGSFAAQHDSLLNDSAFKSLGYLPVLLLEDHFRLIRKGKTDAATWALKEMQSGIESTAYPQSLLTAVNEYMLSYFQKSGNDALALISLNRLYVSARGDIDALQTAMQSSKDSLSRAIANSEKRYVDLDKQAGEAKTLWMVIAGISAIVAIVMMVVWLASRAASARKIKALLEKNSDRSEQELLSRKVNELRSETAELRKTAQLTIDRLNTMDASRREALTNLKSLGDELNSGLGEMKQQLTSGKSALPPATFMALQNAITRTGTNVSQLYEQISQRLK